VTKNPLISVVIPTQKNREELLERAIKSIKKQTYKRIEIIPVLEGNNAADSRNIGIDKSSGKYIAFLDDDDEWLPDKLEKQVKKLENHPSVNLVICWTLDKRYDEQYIDKYPEFVYLYNALKLFRLSSTSSYIFRKSALEKFDVNFPTAQEYELAIRTLMTSVAMCVQEVGVIMYKTENQMTRNWKGKRKGLKMLYKKHKQLYKKYGWMEFIKFRIKFFGIISLYWFAEIFGDKVYKIIVPIKRRGDEK